MKRQNINWVMSLAQATPGLDEEFKSLQLSLREWVLNHLNEGVRPVPLQAALLVFADVVSGDPDAECEGGFIWPERPMIKEGRDK